MSFNFQGYGCLIPFHETRLSLLLLHHLTFTPAPVQSRFRLSLYVFVFLVLSYWPYCVALVVDLHFAVKNLSSISKDFITTRFNRILSTPIKLNDYGCLVVYMISYWSRPLKILFQFFNESLEMYYLLVPFSKWSPWLQ